MQIEFSGDLNKSYKLVVDGEVVTDTNNIVSIEFSADGGYRTSDGYNSSGRSHLSYDKVVDGIITSVSHRSNVYNTEYKPLTNDSIKIATIDFLGKAIPQNDIVDKIILKCAELKIPCQPKEALLTRTIESLTDKLFDLENK